MNYKLKSIIAIIISILSLYVLLFASIDFHAFNKNFYKNEAIRLDLKKNMHMNNHDIYNLSDTLLDYLKGYRNDIEVRVTKNGIERFAYTSNETKHMKDVRDLYLDARLLAYFSIGVIILLLFIITYDNPKEIKGILANAYLKTSILVLFLLCALCLYAFSDFNTFWNNFHGVFFSNDLWLLPSNSLMIQLLPESLFMHMVIRIIVTFGLGFILLNVISVKYLNKLKRKVLS